MRAKLVLVTVVLGAVKLYIHYLRKKIERDPNTPDFILTSRGVGYRFANK